MKITLITVGKIKEKYLRDAIGEYSKRLSKYCKLEIIEVADEKTDFSPSVNVLFCSNRYIGVTVLSIENPIINNSAGILRILNHDCNEN